MWPHFFLLCCTFLKRAMFRSAIDLWHRNNHSLGIMHDVALFFSSFYVIFKMNHLGAEIVFPKKTAQWAIWRQNHNYLCKEASQKFQTKTGFFRSENLYGEFRSLLENVVVRISIVSVTMTKPKTMKLIVSVQLCCMCMWSFVRSVFR